MEKKIIGSGHGWRIVADHFAPDSWDRTSYKSGTIIVHLPSRGTDYFYSSAVVTQGISGQPQLTFDDPAKAQDFADYLNRRVFSGGDWRISKIRGDYECYKIPLRISGGTIDAWLSTRQFPPEGSEKWQHLCELFPRYFSNIRRGFFHENYQDRVIDYPVPERQEILRIINSASSEEQKCRDLFNVELTELQRLNKRNFDEEVSPIEEHYYVSYSDYNAPHQWSLFIHADYDRELEMNLTQSCKHYCFGEGNADDEYAGYRNDVQGWWAALEATIEYWAENGDNIRHSVKRRGFFDENVNTNLNEEDSQDVCTFEELNQIFNEQRWDEFDEKIIQILSNCSNEEKCIRIFNRTVDQLTMYNALILFARWSDQYYNHISYDIEGFKGFVSGDENNHSYRHSLRWIPETLLSFDQSIWFVNLMQELLEKSNGTINRQLPEAEKLAEISLELKDLATACGHFGYSPFFSGDGKAFNFNYNLGGDLRMSPSTRWKGYLNLIDYLERELIRYQKKRGFFMESLIGRNLTGQEIVAIMHDQNLSSNDKCFKLFGKGRTPEYIRDLQHSTYYTSSLNKYIGILSESDLRELKSIAGDLAFEAETNGKNRTGKLSMFYTTSRCDFEESYDYYCIEGGHFSHNNPETEQERALFWWEYIDYCVDCLEQTGLVPDAPHNKTRGFFGS